MSSSTFLSVSVTRSDVLAFVVTHLSQYSASLAICVYVHVEV